MKDGGARRRGPRWSVALALLSLTLTQSSCAYVYYKIGGNFRGEPSEMVSELSAGAHRLLERSFEGIDTLNDYHVHMLSAQFHRSWVSWYHPIKRARTMVYLSAAGVELGDTMVQDYVRRLQELIRTIPRPGRHYLYALDAFYGPDGEVDWDRTPLYVPNASVVDLADRVPDVFVPVISIHPFRRDAIEKLEAWSLRGCRHVKWLPNSMGIDPSSPRLERFYAKMRELDMVLLSHTGEENAFEAGAQQLGNPLLLRKPLDMGVKVVALHAASKGDYPDLDDPDGGDRRVSGFDLLVRLLEEPKYEHLLFADTACLTFFNHLQEPLRKLLERPDLHHRFVHGSDYPFPAVNLALRTSRLAAAGFITREERRLLNEIYNYNPLLFDFVVKRTVKHPETGQRLSTAVFEVPSQLR